MSEKKAKVRRAALALKAAVKKTGWTEETQLDFLSHFTVEQKAAVGVLVDQKQLTDSSMQFAGEVGWEVTTPINMLCQDIDDNNLNVAFEAFLVRAVQLYLDDMAMHGAALPEVEEEEAAPESTDQDLHFSILSLTLDKAADILSLTEPIAGVEMGEAILRWTFDFPGDRLTAHIEVCNGDPPYVDAFLVETVNDFRTVVDTLPVDGTLERAFAFEYDDAVFRVTLHRS